MAILATAFPFTSEVTYDEHGWPQLDRAVDSAVLRNMIKKFFSNGLFLSADANCWKVTADETATVSVAPGAGLIQGVTGYTVAGSLTLTAGDADMGRYDMIVAKLNDNSNYRRLYIEVVEGEPAVSPTYPALTRTGSVWELGLAAVYRPAGSTTVSASQVTDLRANSSFAGQVNALDSIDTSEWFDQLEGYTQDFLSQCQSVVSQLSTYEGTMETSFSSWFDAMRDQLSEDAAGHLQNEIGDTNYRIDDLEDLVGVPAAYNTSTVYSEGDYCTYNGYVQRAKQLVYNETFTQSHWEQTSVLAEAKAQATAAADDLESRILNCNILTNVQVEEEYGHFLVESALEAGTPLKTVIPYLLHDLVSNANALNLQDNSVQAPYRNSIYRGRPLGTEVTAEQWENIADGSFKNMFIGDYWTINDRVYRIAAFDYYLGTGDGTDVTTGHHVVLVPDAVFYRAAMNDTDTTDGAYVGSKMYTDYLTAARSTILEDFGSANVLTHRQYLKNTVTSGAESAAEWAWSSVDLMTEQNVYGEIIYANQTNKRTLDKTQFPLFAMNPKAILSDQDYWLRDVSTSSGGFCNVNNSGLCYSTKASASRGVRPAFCIS